MQAGRVTILGAFQLLALAVFLITVVGQSIHIRLRKRVNPIALDLWRKGKWGLVEILLFASVNLWAAAVVIRALSPKSSPFVWPCGVRPLDAIPAKLLGVTMILCAFVVFIMALRALGNSWRLGIDEKNPGPLVTTGIYSYSRNPIYLFFDLYFLGTFFINGGLFFLIMTVLVALILHFQILQEERVLVNTHGTAYEAYSARTARYIAWPSLRRSR
jgi:protein-S-isoprenylcysteine O-methyltransferase Ste14